MNPLLRALPSEFEAPAQVSDPAHGPVRIRADLKPTPEENTR